MTEVDNLITEFSNDAVENEQFVKSLAMILDDAWEAISDCLPAELVVGDVADRVQLMKE